jgi:hypothetical protein
MYDGTNFQLVSPTTRNFLETLLTGQADLLYASAANTLARLAKGTAYQKLRMNVGATAPEWYTTPSVKVYNNATQAITNDTLTPAAFNSESYDTDTMHDTSTNNTRITINTAGKYRISAIIEFPANATGIRQILLKVNNTTYIAADTRDASSTIPIHLYASIDHVFVATDYVEVIVYQNSGGNLNISASASTERYKCEFMACLIG